MDILLDENRTEYTYDGRQVLNRIKKHKYDIYSENKEAIRLIKTYSSVLLNSVSEEVMIEDIKKVMSVGKVNRIMLDNFTPEMIKEGLKIIEGKYETEASGGINLSNIQSFAETGVDYISSGAIIHQARSLDLSLKAKISS
jgi:nicotinate-nucleotide pyrophosphorylase